MKIQICREKMLKRKRTSFLSPLILNAVYFIGAKLRINFRVYFKNYYFRGLVSGLIANMTLSRSFIIKNKELKLKELHVVEYRTLEDLVPSHPRLLSWVRVEISSLNSLRGRDIGHQTI